MVIAEFDSSEPAMLQGFDSTTNNANTITASMGQDDISAVQGVNQLADVGGWPAQVLVYGIMRNGYPAQYYGPQVRCEYTYELSLGQLSAGDDYVFSVGSMFGGIRPLSSGDTFAVNVYFKLYSDAVLVRQSILYESEEYAYPNFMVFQTFSDDLVYEFIAPDGYCHMELVVEFIPWSASRHNSLSGPMTWLGFVGAQVLYITPPDLDEEFRDEQRGWWARLLAMLEDIWEAIKGIPEFLANLPQMILDGIKHLFIPEDGELQEIVDDFKEFAEGRLGFVSQIFTLVPDVIGQMVDGGDDGDVILTLPKAELPDEFGGVTLWEDTGFNLSKTVRDSKALSMVYDIYKVLASVLLLGMLLRYLYKVAEDILGQRGDGED